MSDYRIVTRVYTLPGEERLIDAIHNNPLYVITNKIVTPMPKKGIIMVYLEYEDYTKERV